jgi:hypothetical protein
MLLQKQGIRLEEDFSLIHLPGFFRLPYRRAIAAEGN